MPGEAATPWIDGLSAQAVGEAVRSAVPRLAGAAVELNVSFEQSNPYWHHGTARVGPAHFVKFAWSQEAANELAHERRVMLALSETRFARWMPPLLAAPQRPLLIVTQLVEGVPCWGDVLDDASVNATLARDLADALADLHDPAVVADLRRDGIEPRAPAPQAETGAIRSRLGRFLDAAHVPLVHRWCDWTDHVQARPTGERVLLHGDVHGHNLLVHEGRLRCVLDYDAVSLGDHHYDLRYLPTNEPTIGFLVRTAEEYERRTGRVVEPAPLLAWHIRTVLGDALWRSEAGVPLPGGGTVHEWVEELRVVIGELAEWRPFALP
ncbi:MAG TPA: phosphotransferase [Kofleriaceae bacterium]|jgi:aminoglycoside phosphotransferase (APT) family kinase protein